MSKDKSHEQPLSAVISEMGLRPNVWSAAPVNIEPEIWLEAWQVFKVVKNNGSDDRFGLHFVGRNGRDYNGAVSSKVKQFDPVTMRGVTNSGRVYQLVGHPGFSDDAQYVLNNWCRFNQVEVENATADFIEQYGISVDNLTN